MSDQVIAATSSPRLAAEFPYFRLARAKWELMLTRLRQMGITSLIVTVPWGFHELERRSIDLTGVTNPRRDLVGLLKLCTVFNLDCALRFGPDRQQGVLGDGLPLWLLRAVELEAVWAEATLGWLKAISQNLVAYQSPAGPISSLHLEIEARSGLVPGEQLTEVKWPIWLRKHYSGIEALNAAYGATYRTVNEVKFPADWSSGASPLHRDAQTFMAHMQQAAESAYRQPLIEAGWHIPLVFSGSEPQRPVINLTSAAEVAKLSSLVQPGPDFLGIDLLQPIQVDPDPPDVGSGLSWAKDAPIRSDGSLRPSFWLLRQALWPHHWPQTQADEQALTLVFSRGALVTRAGDSPLKIDLSAGTKAAIYRLNLNGELVVDNALRVSRGKLAGVYRAEDAAAQTDLVLILNDSAAPLSDFPLAYLGHLLTVQAHTLTRCAELTANLGQSLGSGQVEAPASEPASKSEYVLTNARRGLREADAALRKALASISGLEAGFATMLAKETTPPPAVGPVAVVPEMLEGAARAVLTEVSAACAKIAPALQAAANSLQRTVTTTSGFTVEQYRQGYSVATEAARATLVALEKILGLLRLEIASEKLPLVAWRIHQQVQEIAESLRWGVLWN